jgi:hypothetical protein
MSEEKLRSCLNLRRLHTWWMVQYLFVELQLRVVVVSLPCLSPPSLFFLEAFCDISHRLGGITPFGVFSDAFPGYWLTALVLQSWAVTPEMAARPYSGSFSSLGQSPVPALPHIPSCPTGPLIAPPKLWQICGPERWRHCYLPRWQ